MTQRTLRTQRKIKSFTAKDAEAAKERNSFNAKYAKTAKEMSSLNAKDAKTAKEMNSLNAKGAKPQKTITYTYCETTLCPYPNLGVVFASLVSESFPLRP